MQKATQILIDQSHRQAWSIDAEKAKELNPGNPQDSGYSKLVLSAEASGFGVRSHETGTFTKESLSGVDVLVIPHASDDDWEKTLGEGSPKLTSDEISAVKEFVNAGGGLVVLGESEQPKYGNNFSELTEHFGIKIANATVQDSENNFKGVATWVLADLKKSFEFDLGFKVEQTAFYRSGVLEIKDGCLLL